MLTLTDVGYRAHMPEGGDEQIISGIDLSVASNDRIGLMGRSGSGKSTLLSILALFEEPTEGRYQIDGVDTTRLTESERSRLRAACFGFVFQRFFLIGHLTAVENVETALLHGTVPLGWRDRRARVMDALASVGLSGRGQHTPTRLSGGEQQRVAIARAIVKRPGFILADEPSGALDESTAETVMDVLIHVADRTDAGMVVATHDAVVASRMDRVVMLSKGALAECQ